MIIKSKINTFLNIDTYIPNIKELLIIAFFLGITAYLELALLEPWSIASELHSASYLWVAYAIIETLTFLICLVLPAILHRRGKESFICKTWKVIGLFTAHLLVTALLIIIHDINYFHDTLPNDFPILKGKRLVKYVFYIYRILLREVNVCSYG